MRFKPPKFLRELMPSLVWDIPDGDSGGDVYLTFDDGPTPGVTEWILEELARHGAKATFFCLGKNVEQYPDLCRRILAEGHRVGNHTYSHAKGGFETSVVRYIENVERADEFVHSTLFRPPYGRISPKKAHLLSSRYKIVMWNIISRDYNRRLSRRACLNNVVKHVKPGDIVVFHDSEKAFKNIRYALPRTLEYLQNNGMRSKVIEL